MINLPDDVTIHVFKGVKLMNIYDKTTGFPRLDNELTRHENGLDKEWAKNRNREIEEEVLELRDYLSNNYTTIDENNMIRSKISELLKERDDITYKYGLAGEHFNRLYLDKTGADRDGDILSNESRFRFITEEMEKLYSRKNADYGDAFTESLDEDGRLVSKIRIKDKLNRFSQLISNDALVNDESMRDTLIDLANYAVMTLMWLDENE